MSGVKLKLIYFICIVLVVEAHVWKMNGQTSNVGDSKSTTHTFECSNFNSNHLP
jgi:hypothetical protein